MKKLFGLLAGSVLSLGLVAGCNNDTRNDLNPPPPQVNDNNDTLDRDNNLNNRRDGINDGIDNNMNDRYNNDRFNNDLNDNHYSPAEDKNTNTDKDPAKDRNTKQEEIIEDDIDRNDADNKDE